MSVGLLEDSSRLWADRYVFASDKEDAVQMSNL